VSASAFEVARSECFAAGCDAFLAKPFREEELRGVLESQLNLRWIYADHEESHSPFPAELRSPPTAELAASMNWPPAAM